MNYITRTLDGITLYFDGEKFQTEQSKAANYEYDEAMQEIERLDLQYAEITAVVYNGTGWMLNQIFS